MYHETLSQAFHPIDLHFASTINPHGSLASRYFIAFLLKTAREGHLCVYLHDGYLQPSLGKDEDLFLLAGEKNIPQLLFEGPLAKEENRIYLRRNFLAEKKFLLHWNRLISNKPEIAIPQEWLKMKMQNEILNEEQRSAIMQSSNRSLSLIVGGPGTGKTHMAKRLVSLFGEKLGSVVLAAPTGKAAANLRQALPNFEVKTLHSLLKTPYLFEDLILVDEGSMIDAETMARLFSSIKEKARLIILGDPDQLPPVETGNFFSDLVHEKSSISYLKTCLRAELEEIVLLGDKIKKGMDVPFKPLPSFAELLQYIQERENKSFRILTPLRKGPYGADILNSKIFQALGNKNKIPILIKVNEPRLQLHNGDAGFLDVSENYAIFGEKRIPRYLLPPYELGYVHSVHKSQGSEYDEVIILLGPGSEVFSREMLYTAVSRAKKKVEIFTEKSTLNSILGKKTQRISAIIDKGLCKKGPC